MGIRLPYILLFLACVLTVSTVIFTSDLRLATLMVNAGDFDGAIRHYEQRIAAAADDFDSRRALGLLYMKVGEQDSALGLLEAALPHAPEDTEILDHLIALYAAKQQKDRLIDVLERRLVQSPDDASLRKRLAATYEWAGRRRKALTAFTQLSREAPENASYHLKLAYLHRDLSGVQEALPPLRRYLERRPQDAEANFLLGYLATEAGLKEEAADAFERGLAIDPQKHSARLQLAGLYSWMSQPLQALPHYERLIANKRADSTAVAQYEYLAQRYDPVRLIRQAELRLQADPADSEAGERLFDLYVFTGQIESALHHLKANIARRPDAPDNYLKLARLYLDIRQPGAASEAYEGAFARGIVDTLLIDELLTYYSLEKAFGKLIRFYEGVLARGAATIDSRERFAETLFRVRRYDDAISQISVLLQHDPANIDYRVDLATALRVAGREIEGGEVLWAGIAIHRLLRQDYLEHTAAYLARVGSTDRAIKCYHYLTLAKPQRYDYRRQLVGLHLKQKRFDLALAQFETVASTVRLTTEDRLEMALLHRLQGDSSAMRARLSEVTRSAPRTPALMRRLGRFYFENGLFSDAIPYLQTALKETPRDSSALKMLGLSYAWNNEPRRARTVLTRFLASYPADYQARFQIGQLYELAGDRRRAQREYAASLALMRRTPPSRDLRVTQGRVHAKRKERNAAIGMFEKLARQYPNDPDLHADYAEALLDLREPALAQGVVRRMLKREPRNYRLRRLLSRALYSGGGRGEAVAVLDSLSRDFPADAGLRIDLADMQLLQGDWFRASRNLEAVLAKRPSHTGAARRLAQLRRDKPAALLLQSGEETAARRFSRRFYRAIYTLAKSSAFRLLFDAERGNVRDAQREYVPLDENRMGITLESRLSPALEGRASIAGISSAAEGELSASGLARVWFTPGAFISLQGDYNAPWRDAVGASNLQGRLHKLTAQIQATVLSALVVGGSLQLEQHYLHGDSRYGTAVRPSLQIAYNLSQSPLISTYYQLSGLGYRYQYRSDAPGLPAAPENDRFHAVGAELSRQFTRRLYARIAGSAGYAQRRNQLDFFGTLEFEYHLLRALRLRSQFGYGTSNGLNAGSSTRSFQLGLGYFY